MTLATTILASYTSGLKAPQYIWAKEGSLTVDAHCSIFKGCCSRAEDTLFITYTWCAVKLALCVWSMGNRCAANGDQIFIWKGDWLNINREYVFDDSEGNPECLEETHTDMRRTPGPSCGRTVLTTTPCCCLHWNLGYYAPVLFCHYLTCQMECSPIHGIHFTYQSGKEPVENVWKGLEGDWSDLLPVTVEGLQLSGLQLHGSI